MHAHARTHTGASDTRRRYGVELGSTTIGCCVHGDPAYRSYLYGDLCFFHLPYLGSAKVRTRMHARSDIVFRVRFPAVIKNHHAGRY
jgi:hypothetical protein